MRVAVECLMYLRSKDALETLLRLPREIQHAGAARVSGDAGLILQGFVLFRDDDELDQDQRAQI